MHCCSRALIFAVAALTLAISGSASAQHLDVLLYDDGSGNARTGGVDVDLLAPDLDTHVFEAELLGDTTLPTPTFAGAEPGFFGVSDAQAGLLPPPNGNLPAGAGVTLDFLLEPTLGLSLARWNQSLGVFEAPGGASILLTTPADPFGGSLDGTSEVLGLVLGTSASNGSLHEHPTFDIGSAQGVFLAYGVAHVDGLASPSNPFWLVFGTLDECVETASCNSIQEAFNEDIELQIGSAMEYTNATLVPEPGTALLLALGLGAFAHGGRRRSR